MHSQSKTLMRTLVALTLALFASTATAHTFYVDARKGRDTNAGSRTAPWKTIQKAADSMQLGDTVLVAAGRYPELVHVSRSGAAGHPITYRASGKVVMEGFKINANYIRVVGFEITRHIATTRFRLFLDSPGISVRGQHNEILNNDIHDVCSEGIIVSGGGNPDSPLTSYNVVKGNRIVHASAQGILLEGRYNLIEANDISHMVQYPPGCPVLGGADADGINPFGTGSVIRKNHIHDILPSDPGNLDPHIDCFETWGPARDLTIEQNVCDLNKTQFLPAQGAQIENSAGPVSHITLRNNIFMNTRMGIHVEQMEHTGMPSILVLNNTFDQVTYHGVLIEGCPGVVVENNAFYNVGKHKDSYLGLSAGSVVYNEGSYLHPNSCPKGGLVVGYNFQGMSDGMAPGKHGSRSPYPHDLWMLAPRFVNAAAGDFRLLPDSPLVNAGIALKDAPTDFRGVARPQGSGYDIGAYEYKPGPASSLRSLYRMLPKDRRLSGLSSHKPGRITSVPVH